MNDKSEAIVGLKHSHRIFNGGDRVTINEIANAVKDKVKVNI